MRNAFAILPILLAAFATTSVAQDTPATPDPVPAPAPEPVPGQEPQAGEPSPIPALPQRPPSAVPWNSAADYYDRYDSPRQAVRRNAELKASQRRARIAARKWMGYSPLRPPASPLPFMGSYQNSTVVGVFYPLAGSIYQPALPRVIASPTGW